MYNILGLSCNNELNKLTHTYKAGTYTIKLNLPYNKFSLFDLRGLEYFYNNYNHNKNILKYITDITINDGFRGIRNVSYAYNMKTLHLPSTINLYDLYNNNFSTNFDINIGYDYDDDNNYIQVNSKLETIYIGDKDHPYKYEMRYSNFNLSNPTAYLTNLKNVYVYTDDDSYINTTNTECCIISSTTNDDNIIEYQYAPVHFLSSNIIQSESEVPEPDDSGEIMQLVFNANIYNDNTILAINKICGEDENVIGTINWGDGNIQSYDSRTDTIVTHTFDSASTYYIIFNVSKFKTIGTDIFNYISGGNLFYVTTLYIPNGIETIGYGAFYNCSEIVGINLPSTLIRIEDLAFCYNCDITSLILPDNIEYIGDYAFYDLYNLTELILPNSITHIGNYAFMLCSNLTNITISSNLDVINYFTFCNCNNCKTLTFNGKPKIINDYAFYYAYNLTQINMDGSELQHIGRGAFYYSYNLHNGFDLTNVDYIGPSAFENCYNYNDNILLNNATYIGDFAFYNMRYAKLLYMPNVNYIGSNAFYYFGYSNSNSDIPEVYTLNISDTCTYIGRGAFYYSRFNNLVFPTSCTNGDTTYIGASAFANMSYVSHNIIIPEHFVFTDTIINSSSNDYVNMPFYNIGSNNSYDNAITIQLGSMENPFTNFNYNNYHPTTFMNIYNCNGISVYTTNKDLLEQGNNTTYFYKSISQYDYSNSNLSVNSITPLPIFFKYKNSDTKYVSNMGKLINGKKTKIKAIGKLINGEKYIIPYIYKRINGKPYLALTTQGDEEILSNKFCETFYVTTGQVNMLESTSYTSAVYSLHYIHQSENDKYIDTYINYNELEKLIVTYRCKHNDVLTEYSVDLTGYSGYNFVVGTAPGEYIYEFTYKSPNTNKLFTAKASFYFLEEYMFENYDYYFYPFRNLLDDENFGYAKLRYRCYDGDGNEHWHYKEINRNATFVKFDFHYDNNLTSYPFEEGRDVDYSYVSPNTHKVWDGSTKWYIRPYQDERNENYYNINGKYFIKNIQPITFECNITNDITIPFLIDNSYRAGSNMTDYTATKHPGSFGYIYWGDNTFTPATLSSNVYTDNGTITANNGTWLYGLYNYTSFTCKNGNILVDGTLTPQYINPFSSDFNTHTYNTSGTYTIFHTSSCSISDGNFISYTPYTVSTSDAPYFNCEFNFNNLQSISDKLIKLDISNGFLTGKYAHSTTRKVSYGTGVNTNEFTGTKINEFYNYNHNKSTSYGKLNNTGVFNATNNGINSNINFVTNLPNLTTLTLPELYTSFWVKGSVYKTKIPNTVNVTIYDNDYYFGYTTAGFANQNGAYSKHSASYPNYVSKLFVGCTSLTDVTYLGTLDSWQRATINQDTGESMLDLTVQSQHINIHCTDGDTTT